MDESYEEHELLEIPDISEDAQEVINGSEEYDAHKDHIDVIKDYETKRKTYQTTPVLTKYERTRVLAERASQINSGSPVFIPNPENYTNSYDIALKELQLKKIPFIVKRPYGNHYEYWKLEDLL
jgi:DNA-directed RNA polymerase subunit K/omega